MFAEQYNKPFILAEGNACYFPDTKSGDSELLIKQTVYK